MADDPDDIFGGAGLTTTRARVADIVFAHLARAILTGKIEPGEPLPAERDLAERYTVSRILVREAVHKLKDLGLVRVKQGGQTIVLDPREASDPRIMALELDLDGPSEGLKRDVTEKLLGHIVTLLTFAQGRIASKELDALTAIGEQLEAKTPEAERVALVTDFWSTIARSTKNSVFQRETKYWLDIATRAAALSCLWSIEKDAAFYTKLVARLRRENDAAAILFKAVRVKLGRE